ncbi:MAG: hypothetical protein VX409_02880 [Verrucomicrobiota bacterium]|nr:hypothetical protein [Verrucomicrobiota bacterium]
MSFSSSFQTASVSHISPLVSQKTEIDLHPLQIDIANEDFALICESLTWRWRKYRSFEFDKIRLDKLPDPAEKIDTYYSPIGGLFLLIGLVLIRLFGKTLLEMNPNPEVENEIRITSLI